MTRPDVNIEVQHNGSLLVTHTDDKNRSYKQVYYGYTKKEAIKKFRDYIDKQKDDAKSN